MNIHPVAKAVAFRNHLSGRLGRLDPKQDGDKIKDTMLQIDLQQAIVQNPQLASVLRAIERERRPGYVNLLHGLGYADKPGLTVMSNHAAAPAKWWHVDGKRCWVNGEILDGGEIVDGGKQFIEETAGIDTLYLNSGGGCSMTGLLCAEALESRRVHVIVTGRCMSSAMSLLLAGSTRSVRSDAKLMIHSPRQHIIGTPDELRAGAASLETSIAPIVALYCRRTGWPEHTVRKWFDGQDHYLTPEQAVAMNLADEVFAAPPEDPLPVTSAETPAEQDNSSLFVQWLQAFGDVKTRDKAALFRELQAWSAYHIKTV